MALISYGCGLTMHIGEPQANEYIKMNVEVKDFDTELDFDEQIQKVHATVMQLMEWGDQVLGEKMEAQLGKKILTED